MSLEKNKYYKNCLNSIDYVDYTNYKEKFDKLVQTVQILNGKIYGDFISQYYFENNILNKDDDTYIDINFKEINVIFNNYNDRVCFARLMQNIFEMYQNYKSNSNGINKINTSNFHILVNYNHLDKDYSKVININIYNNVTFVDLNFHIHYIDVNLLSLQDEGLNLIKYFSKNRISRIDNGNSNYLRFNSILNRVINKRFSFIENYNNNIFDNLDKSIDLILNGWIMDDYHLKDETCVLFLWKNIDNNIRTTYNKKDMDKMKNCNTCSICTSKFKDNDLVINTKCNHNFHWDCNNYNSGIKNWILNFSHKCPMCRYNYCI